METKKFNATIKGFVIVWAIAFAVSFLNQYLHIAYHNSVRKNIFIDSVKTDGIVKSIFDGRSAKGFDRYPRSAQYYFYADSSIFYGGTFYTYKGNIGDTIYLLYKKSNPKESLSYFDIKPEVISKNILIRDAKRATGFALMILLFMSIASWWKARKAKKKISNKV